MIVGNILVSVSIPLLSFITLSLHQQYEIKELERIGITMGKSMKEEMDTYMNYSWWPNASISSGQ